MSDDARLLTTSLDQLHRELGARMVPFAGYSMPVQYPTGLMVEHRHTRESASLFDVSHMGQLSLKGDSVCSALESIIPMDVIGLDIGKQRYGLLLDEHGGILDDLMFFKKRNNELFVIVNGACKVGDIAFIREKIANQCCIIEHPERALLALQGPKAVMALSRIVPGVEKLIFMTGGDFSVVIDGKEVPLFLTRSGYTGEDGFEISVHQDDAIIFAKLLLAQPEVRPAGLGARNSLRLEAGLCLYGNDMDNSTTPIEANLVWAIQKVRKPGGIRAGGFTAAEKLQPQIEEQLLNGNGSGNRVRVGLIALERVPVREDTEIFNESNVKVGVVTSGLLSPTLDRPIAMAYVDRAYAKLGTRLLALVRGKSVLMEVSNMPFVPTKYYRG